LCPTSFCVWAMNAIFHSLSSEEIYMSTMRVTLCFIHIEIQPINLKPKSIIHELVSLFNIRFFLKYLKRENVEKGIGPSCEIKFMVMSHGSVMCSGSVVQVKRQPLRSGTHAVLRRATFTCCTGTCFYPLVHYFCGNYSTSWIRFLFVWFL